ncbi:vacuolar-sorting protein SNF8-like [Eurytemora carolleeae]|uniref:vacuolar-sorting protein SNF8-like n=1 Tax=Eurytemora carolleeae TaxID=1294199 RepID=UPI000C78CA69|nr:vacuolar-sorting protein SNF8-like [Eurytemora carolleeae]|eukprot:XP_023330847.1 vacuolar-sorting protein SNF8-like [Eurytemora affinis]
MRIGNIKLFRLKMRKRAGIGAIHKKKLDAEKFKGKADALAETQLVELSSQLQTFQINLESFAREHKQEIKKDPAFRKHFQDMCASIGVDPLASGKGFWSNMLEIGDFYYELAVQIVEVCMAHADKTGGLMELGDVKHKLIKSRGRSAIHQEISTEDILIATKKLKVLGTGFTVIPLGSGRYLVQSVPGELSSDQITVLQEAEDKGGSVSRSSLKQLKWEDSRIEIVLNTMLGEGLLWVDEKGSETMYWVPSIFSSKYQQ